MKSTETILFRGENLTTAAILAATFVEARRHFAGLQLPLPPLPADIASYVGCELLITKLEKHSGERIGRVRLIRSDSVAVYDESWVIANPS